MPDRRDIRYSYDQSFDGLLCCVFESYTKRETPCQIQTEEDGQASLFPARYIETDPQKAERVRLSIPKRMGNAALPLLATAFLFDHPQTAMTLYRFIRLGYRYGPNIVDMLQLPDVSRVHQMVRAVGNEAHLLSGFVRFSQYPGGLTAVIEPKHQVLPLMEGHFSSRFPEEVFLIFDKTHRQALFYRPYESRILPLDELELPSYPSDQLPYSELWRTYYQAISIRERENPRCRMSHMPKRFWPHLHEMDASAPRLTSQERRAFSLDPPAENGKPRRQEKTPILQKADRFLHE